MLREQAAARAKEKVEREYAKVRREYEREQVATEAAKAKNKAGMVIQIPAEHSTRPMSTGWHDGVKRRLHCKINCDENATSQQNSQDKEGEEKEPLFVCNNRALNEKDVLDEEEEIRDHICQRRRNAFEGARDNSPGPYHDEFNDMFSNTQNLKRSSQKSRSPSPSLPVKPQPMATFEGSNDEENSHNNNKPGTDVDSQASQSLHPNRAALISKLSKNSFLSRAATKAERRRHKLELRMRERERREQERQEATAERERIRKLKSKALRTGPDGRRKLGRESNVLIEQVKKLVGDKKGDKSNKFGNNKGK